MYQRCINQVVVNGEQTCPGGIHAEVYDSNNQSFVADLEQADPNISGFDTTLRKFFGGVEVAWSSDGRYLAYRYIPASIHRNFDLAIRDLETNQDLELDFPNEFVDYNDMMSWSPINDRLIFWIHGRFGEDQVGDSFDTTRHPIIFDVTHMQFIPADRPYEFPPNYLGNPVKWSPDGNALVFTDSTKNLIYMDTQSGITTLLDTNVTTIIDWISVPDILPTPTDTATTTDTDTPTATDTPTNTAISTNTPTLTNTPSSTPTNTSVPSAPVITIAVPPTDNFPITSDDQTRLQAVAYNPAVGTSDGAGIQQVEFEIRDSANNLLYSLTDTASWYCVFGGDGPCSPAPAPIASAPAGTYTLRARAKTTGGVYTDWVSRTFVLGGAPTNTPSPTPGGPTNTPTPTPTATATGGPFPAAGVLDNFNRSNGAVGSNWSGTTGGYQIASNRLDVGSGGDTYWHASAFGADQEVYVTLTQIDANASEIDLLLKSQSATTYGSGVLEVWYKPSTHTVQVWTFTTAQNWVQRGSNISVTFAAGDRFGARATSDGTVRVYQNNTQIGSVSLGNWPFTQAAVGTSACG